MESRTSATGGVSPGTTSTTFSYALCSHDETNSGIHRLWSRIRDKGLLSSEPGTSAPAPPKLRVMSMLPCPDCFTKEASESRINIWLIPRREDTPGTRIEYAWIGFALQRLRSEQQHITRWAYLCVERLGAELALGLASIFGDGPASRSLKDNVDAYNRPSAVRTERANRGVALNCSWAELSAASRMLRHQLTYTCAAARLDDVSELNQAGAEFVEKLLQMMNALVEESNKIPEVVANAQLSESNVRELALLQEKLAIEIATARRSPSETGLDTLLPFHAKPSTDEAHRLSTAIKGLASRFGRLREIFEAFQETVNLTERALEAE